MEFFFTLLSLFAAIILATILNKKWPAIPSSLFQIGTGIVLSVIPLSTPLAFRPELFMICVIAPLLFIEGQYVSRKELWMLRGPVLLLAFGLVFATVFAVGFLIHGLIPDMRLSVGFALAAIISPTDIVAVNAITKGKKLPGDLMATLEGESLLNDAAGIVAFKVALAAALTGEFSLRESAFDFLIVAVGGIVVGLLMGLAIVKFRLYLRQQELEEISMLVVIQIMTSLAIYIVAESLEVSGILAVVAAGIVHGIERERLQKTTTKLQIISSNTWYIIRYILNGLVFVMLGFMLPSVYVGLVESHEKGILLLIGLAFFISFILFLLRFIWVYLLYDVFTEKRISPINQFFISTFHLEHAEPEEETKCSRFKYSFIAAVCGIHGTITLATALSIPYVLPDGHLFPLRDTVLFIAAGVILISLIMAACVLPLLINTPESTDDEILSSNEAYKRILKGVMRQMNSQATKESSRAVHQVIQDLGEQLADLEKASLKSPDENIIRHLIEIGAEKEMSAVLELAKEKQISESTVEVYELYLSRKKQILAPSPMKGMRMAFRMWLFKRKLSKAWNSEWETKLTNVLDKNEKHISEFRYAQKTASKAAVQFITNQTNEGNRHETILVLQSYNRYLKQLGMIVERGTKFEEETKHYHLMAIQISRDMIQQMIEENHITPKVAKELRENLLYDEMLIIGD